MNSSTASDITRKAKINRQSSITLTFFCIVIIMIASTSCTQGIFSTPYGGKTFLLDTLSYDQSVITSTKNLSADASGNKLLQDKVGKYLGLSTEFIIKFTNFTVFTHLADSIDFVMNEAKIKFFLDDYWGDAGDFSIDLNMVDPDTSLHWLNTSDVEKVYTDIEGRTSFYSSFSFNTSDESIEIPIDLNTISNWYEYPDSNTGFTVTPSAGSEGLIAFYAMDHKGTFDPRIEIQCTLNDTNGTYIKDSTFSIYCSGDLQQSVNERVLDEDLFYLSQGNISRSYIEMDSLRVDTLLGPRQLLNRAELKFLMDDSLSSIGENDTLKIGARLFRSDYWEIDSLTYIYTALSNKLTSIEDTVVINIVQLIQYLVSNPKDMEYEGIFFYLENDLYDFNQILIDPDDISLDIVYTKVNDE